MTEQQEQITPQHGDTENSCVVCFKATVIYSIGCCNHPVCFECSARMRCLCLQNECPICRQDLPKVIFTKSIEQFSSLDRHIRSGLYEKKYKIMFADMDIQRAFYHLLEHRCPICPDDQRPFVDFHKLKEHVRKAHERFYCEICTENLKIFSSERRSYTRQELATHRRVGDPDNKSHKGHPRCDYCELRYLDKDELFRHLRREHYFCHLCDADGKNLYYGTIQEMRQHFKSEHFLCEEDDCVTEEFTAVFRSEIDLRAHKATVHSRGMSRAEARQARTLELDFSYAPRGRQGGEGGGGGRRDRFTHDTQREFDSREIPEQQIVQQPPVKIDASSEEQFPSLAPSASNASAPQVQLANSVRHVVYGQAGLKKTKENFPALGGDVKSKPQQNVKQQVQSSKQPSASSLFKAPKANPQQQKQQAPSKPPQSKGADFPTLPQNTSTKLSSTFMTQLPQRPSTSSTTPVKTAAKVSDFPALPQNASKSKAKEREKLMEDMVVVNSNIEKGIVSAKHRNLVNDYVSLASQMTKVQLVKQKDEVVVDNTPKSVPKLNSTNNFPTLGSSEKSSDQTTSKKLPEWISVKPTGNKQAPKPNPTPKVPQNKQQNSNGVKKQKDEKKSKEKQNQKSEVLKSKNNDLSVPLPPGFKKSDIVSKPKFIPPPEMAKRNEALMEELEKILKTHDQMQEFKVLSQLFRGGSYFARSYYESCKGVLGEKFDAVFPELIALLPDIEKQQKLYRIHLEESGGESAGGKQGKKKKFILDACPTCQQVVLSKDFSQHLKAHPNENQILNNFKNSNDLASTESSLN